MDKYNWYKIGVDKVTVRIAHKCSRAPCFKESFTGCVLYTSTGLGP